MPPPALGYENLNDDDVPRSDSVLALLVGESDLVGSSLVRERDRARPLAGSSTLNRLELGTPEGGTTDRYKRIVADPAAMDGLLVDVFLESNRKAPREIWLDLDARTTRCTVIRKAGFSTATTVTTAICRCTSSAASISCVRR